MNSLVDGGVRFEWGLESLLAWVPCRAVGRLSRLKADLIFSWDRLGIFGRIDQSQRLSILCVVPLWVFFSGGGGFSDGQ